MLLSVVLPTYNEVKNIGILIDKIIEVVKHNKIKTEIIVIDDNSSDGTIDVVKGLTKKYRNIKLFIRPKKLGLGSAHFFGYNKSSGDVIISMDTDLSHDPELIPKLLEKINDGYDIVIGSRHMKGAYYEKPNIIILMKYFFSKFGNCLISFIMKINIHDFTNGYRALRREMVDNIEIETKDNIFLMEFIVKAVKRGYKVSEVPVSFFDRKFGSSKLNLCKEAFKFFPCLIKYKRFYPNSK